MSRTWGDCYGYLMVATGRAGVMVVPSPPFGTWPLFADPRRGGWHFHRLARPCTIHSGQAIATNGLVLDEVLAIVRDRYVVRSTCHPTNFGVLFLENDTPIPLIEKATRKSQLYPFLQERT